MSKFSKARFGVGWVLAGLCAVKKTGDGLPRVSQSSRSVASAGMLWVSEGRDNWRFQ